jgi:hypothetical protein
VTRRDTTTRLLLLAALSKRVKEAENAAKRAARNEFDLPGVRDIGLVAGEQIGHVRVDNGSTSAAVVDEAAFLAWAKRSYPDAVETVERVAPAVRERWLSAVHGPAGGVLNEATGECPIPDGVAVRKGDPKLVVMTSRDAGQVIDQAVASGSLDLGAVLAIGGGEQS